MGGGQSVIGTSLRWIITSQYAVPLEKITYFEHHPEGHVRVHYAPNGWVDLIECDWDALVASLAGGAEL